MARRKFTFGLLWHSMNSDNLGVGALTLGHMDILRDVARELDLEPHFVLIAWTEPRPPYFTRPDIEVVQVRMKDFVRPGGIWGTARRCDIVLDIGGGDSFADIYGWKRTVKMAIGQTACMLAGPPFVFAPQTVGPFARWWTRRIALGLMRRAKLVATRDKPSTDMLHDIGYRGPLIEASDVAFRMAYETPETADDGKVRVGLNVSGLLMNGGYTQDNMFGLTTDYPKLARAIVEYFTGQPNVELHLVGHVISDTFVVEDDHRACAALQQEFPGTVLAPVFQSPPEAKSYIAGMDYFVGARMHACIAAMTTGVPVMPVAYSRKFSGVFGTVGYQHTADCKTESAEDILAKVKYGFENRAQLKAEAEAAKAKGLAMLDDYQAWVKDKVAEIS